MIVLLSILPSWGWCIEFIDTQKQAEMAWHNRKMLDAPNVCRAQNIPDGEIYANTLTDGDTYVGRCTKDGIPNGKGLLITRTGVVGAYADYGVIYRRFPVEEDRNSTKYMGEAEYPHAFLKILWAPETMNGVMPRPPRERTDAADSFIRRYDADDPDGLVPLAREDKKRLFDLAFSISWKYANETADSAEVREFMSSWSGQLNQQQLSQIQEVESRRFYAEYKESFDAINNSSTSMAFIKKYASRDPDKLIPVAEKSYHAYVQREAEIRAEADRLAGQALIGAMGWVGKQLKEGAESLAEERRRNPSCVTSREVCYAQCEGFGRGRNRDACQSRCGMISC